MSAKGKKRATENPAKHRTVADATMAIAGEADRLSRELPPGPVCAGAYHSVMDLQFTAVFRQVPEGYIGFVEELPGANTQGATLDEARANLQEAVALILDANRELAQQSAGTGPVIREPLKVSA
jgi:predicted RNase H-like HicB family nuclease